jgi:hypothetical protein
MAGITAAGEEKAWEMLASLSPTEVCRAAAVSYDSAVGVYTVRSYGMEFHVSPREKKISSSAPGSNLLLERLGEFSRLSILWYLVSAKDIACTGRLVKIGHIRGGEAFSRGSHVLPLNRLAQKYGNDKDGFIEKGKSLGGEVQNYGDAAVRLLPFPRVPVVITLWLADEEFPARADLLLDSSCDLQLPPDITWSIAMMSVLVMMM